MQIVALFDPGLRQWLPLLGDTRNVTSAKAECVLGRKPLPLLRASLGSESSALVGVATSRPAAELGAQRQKRTFQEEVESRCHEARDDHHLSVERKKTGHAPIEIAINREVPIE